MLVRVGFPLPAPDRRIGHIDGLRGCLAVSVLVHHSIIWHQLAFADAGWRAPTVAAFNQFGIGAVALFFMITGFVFYPTILKGWRGADWTRTYVGRAFRILPLVAVTVAAIALILHFLYGVVPSARDAVAALKWTVAWSQPPLLGRGDAKYVNAGVLWSLWHEWFFYLLVLPACALAQDVARGRLPSWAVPAAFLAVAFAAKAVALPRHVEQFLAFFPIGMLAFEAQARPRLRQWFATRRAGFAGTAALLVGATLFAEPTGILVSLLFGLFFVTVACGNSVGGVLARPGDAGARRMLLWHLPCPRHPALPALRRRPHAAAWPGRRRRAAARAPGGAGRRGGNRGGLPAGRAPDDPCRPQHRPAPRRHPRPSHRGAGCTVMGTPLVAWAWRGC